MRLKFTNDRKISIAAIVVLLAAAPAFAQTAVPVWTPIPGSPLTMHYPAPVNPVPPTMRHPDEPPSTPVPQFPPTPAQLKFAHAYVKAVNDGDAAALRKLIAPKALACFNKGNEIFLDEWIERQLRDRIAPAYRITIEELDPADIGKTSLFTLPVFPTHQLDISTVLKGNAVTIGRPIVYQDGEWYEIAPCPTDSGVRHSMMNRQHFSEQHRQAVTLYNSLPPAFKKTLYQLLLQNQDAQACQKTSAQLKVDLQTGCRVAQVLADTMVAAMTKEGAPAAPISNDQPLPTPTPAGASRK